MYKEESLVRICTNHLNELLKREFLTIKPSTGEEHVSLNSHKQREIYEFLDEHNSVNEVN